jgi:hypothetical protein
MVIHYIIVGSVCALGLCYLALVHYLWLGHAGHGDPHRRRVVRKVQCVPFARSKQPAGRNQSPATNRWLARRSQRGTRWSILNRSDANDGAETKARRTCNITNT